LFSLWFEFFIRVLNAPVPGNTFDRQEGLVGQKSFQKSAQKSFQKSAQKSFQKSRQNACPKVGYLGCRGAWGDRR
jgi:hypothetical protein